MSEPPTSAWPRGVPRLKTRVVRQDGVVAIEGEALVYTVALG